MKRIAGRRRRLLRPHLDRRAGHHASALVPVGVRRRRAARTPATAPRCWSAARGGRSAAGSAWTSSSSTSATTARGAGDEVVLFGAGDDGEPTAQDWAEACGTINYEIVTRIGGRFVRRHVVDRGGRREHAPPAPDVAAGAGRVGGCRCAAGVARRAPGHRARRGRRRCRRSSAALRSDPVTVVDRRRRPLHVEVDEVAPYAEGAETGRRRRRAPATAEARPWCSCTATR